MVLAVIQEYVQAIRAGTKYIYQTVPRLLTLWLDMGEDKHHAGTDIFAQINNVVSEAIDTTSTIKVSSALVNLQQIVPIFRSGTPRSRKLCPVSGIGTQTSTRFLAE